ncbi:MAG: hypothetical protein PF501_00350 [Salinisphaera sp.]|nr:hypothetical protein [Salinisphaera sp.]
MNAAVRKNGWLVTPKDANGWNKHRVSWRLDVDRQTPIISQQSYLTLRLGIRRCAGINVLIPECACRRGLA